MKLASGFWGAPALSSMAVLLSIGCGGDFRSSSSRTDGGSGAAGKSTGGKSGGGAPNGGNSGSTGDDSGAGGDGAGGAPSGGGSSGGTAGKGTGGGANGGRGGHGNGGAQTGGSTSAGGASGAGNGGKSGSGGVGNGGTSGAPGGGAGGKDTSQHADDYDQKCNFDSQCSLVNDTSDACGCKTCLNGAISSGDIAKWNADRKAFNCTLPICPGLPCPEMLAACANGACAARKPFYVDAKNYDTACTSNDQCTTIPVGEICDPCQCAVGAVSSTGQQQYKADKAKVACTPAPVACSCAPPIGGPACSIQGGSGVCVMSAVN